MEILKLLLFALFYYIIYNMEFYLKVFLFIASCISVSYFNKYLTMSNDELKENYYYQVYLKILDYYDYLCNFLFKIGCRLNQYTVCYKFYLGIKYVNDHFVKGRRILMMKCGEKMLIMPPPPLFPKQSQPIHMLNQKNYDLNYQPSEEPPVLLTQGDLDNEEDILNFLDNLDKKND